MNKAQATRLTSLTLGALLPVLAAAQSGSGQQYGGMQGNYTLAGIGSGIGYAVWIIFTIIAVIMFVVAGIQFLTARGEPERLTQARSSVIWGIVGIVIGILAYSIIAFTKNSLSI